MAVFKRQWRQQQGRIGSIPAACPTTMKLARSIVHVRQSCAPSLSPWIVRGKGNRDQMWNTWHGMEPLPSDVRCLAFRPCHFLPTGRRVAVVDRWVDPSFRNTRYLTTHVVVQCEGSGVRSTRVVRAQGYKLLTVMMAIMTSHRGHVNREPR